MDANNPLPSYFAPELFHNPGDAPLIQDPLTQIPHDMGEEGALYHSGALNNSSTVDDEHNVKQEDFDSAYPPLDSTMPMGEISMEDMLNDVHDPEAPSTHGSHGSPEFTKPRSKGPGRSRKADSESAPKSHVHSSKNEGQHTDRRFLCYLCNKLFTRRRSVRDHISKIHNTKTWEPVRSLEVIVDPDTGEPVEPIEDIIARGPPPPPPKPTKAQRAEKAAKREAEEDEEQEEEEGGHQAEEANLRDTQDLPAPQAAEPAPLSMTMSLKRESSVAGSRASSTEPFATPQPVAGRKRPAPEDSGRSASAASKKKGTAKVKSSTASHKRTKLGESDQTTYAAHSLYRSPSATPGSTHLKPIPSKLSKQTSAASVRSSPTPASSRAGSEIDSASSSVADTPTSSNDDGEVFCICRKGDNHTWMIACDGGCEEWFHGNCVNIRERDGELIDKYICPTCTKPGLQTTWKRMCRRKDCRKPARVMRDPPSKYCSDECGRMFFVELIQRGDPRAQASKCGQYIVEPESARKVVKTKKKKSEARSKPPKTLVNLVNGDHGDRMSMDSRLATPAYSDKDETEYETDSSIDDDKLPNRGGPLRAGEVKALLEQCKTVEQWRALGRKPDTPPRELDQEPDSKPAPLIFDDLETAKLASIEEEKRQLNERNTMLSARETFLGLVKARSTAITEEVRKANPKFKDVCGFDPRLSWTDEEFLAWYNGQGGKEILDAGPAAKIGPPEDDDNDSHSHQDKKPNGVNGATDPASEEGGETDSMPKKGGVCIKNRCPRHRNWAKGQLAELRFEQDLVRRALGKCEAQENRIKERAVVRGWEMRDKPATT